MPGRDKEGLPESVRESLPAQAQEIYRAAHDNALDQYKEPSKRRCGASLEETAHKVAWAAVKQEYRKNSKGEWVRKAD
jgi:cation transport regulator